MKSAACATLAPPETTPPNQEAAPVRGLSYWKLETGNRKLSYPAFSIMAMETSRFSTISLLTSNSFTFFWPGR